MLLTSKKRKGQRKRPCRPSLLHEKKGSGKSHFADDQSQSDAWQSDWQSQEASWDEWSWDDGATEESYAAKGKGKKGKKGKGKGKGGKDEGKMFPNDGTANLADAPAQNSSAMIAHSFMASSVGEAYLAQPLTPTSMVLDLGCTRAMVQGLPHRTSCSSVTRIPTVASGTGSLRRRPRLLLPILNQQSAPRS